jgi:hypothetical protein
LTKWRSASVGCRRLRSRSPPKPLGGSDAMT